MSEETSFYGKCENKNYCPSRHRIECKNGTKCSFRSSNSCEFLHIENPNVDDTILENIHYTFGPIKVHITKQLGSNNNNE